MKKKERIRKRPETYKAIRARIVTLTLILWLTCMVLVTWLAAVDVQHQMKIGVKELVNTGIDATDTRIPGTTEYDMFSHRSFAYFRVNIEKTFPFMLGQSPASLSSDDWLWGKWNLMYGFEPAVVYYDKDGNRLLGSENYLYFPYTNEEPVVNEHPTIAGYGYIDLDSLSEEYSTFLDLVFRNRSSDILGSLYLRGLKMAGWFEDGEFHPVAVHNKSYHEYIWTQVMHVPADGKKELTQLYTYGLYLTQEQKNPVAGFESLTDLLDAHCTTAADLRSDNLFDSILIASRYSVDGSIKICAALRCCPIGYAALRLIPFYAVSLAVLLIVLKLILGGIRKNLAEPLDGIISALAFHAPLTPQSKWEELSSLERQYVKIQQALAESNTELQQIRTKLDYAQNAEENRRQLVSSLTHELKTPLAVIHSYAEGLQEGIAKEKEDQYLSVILEQSEKMDGLVLQMLDFSRLEAGKVRLSTDNFSLLKLAQTVTDRFQPLLEDKDLTLQYGVCQDFLITADEARIEQVITNLVSNALKYTEPGNAITVSVFQHDGKAGFSIENPGTWLTEEQLEKVWDSFYRADPSRSTPGTGLGLAVVKQIIQLHQGSCKARNLLYKKQEDTYTGVQFSFQIPMG